MARDWTEEKRRQTKEILKVLRETYPDSLNISQIAKKAKMHRHTVPQYLDDLVKEKKIIARTVSRWKVYRIKRK